MNSRSPIPSKTTQLLLCRAADWDATAGSLQRYQRAQGSAWLPVGAAIPVTLGRAGLAWGLGLHPPGDGPGKREGDGRAPAGVFALTTLFGYAAADDPWVARLRLPYLPARPDLKCVDDPDSRHYNCLVDQAATAPDWASCEDMLRQDARYAVGAVVAHNPPPAEAGAGSCVFLHVWAAPGVPTAGCTAMALDDMKAIAEWLEAAQAPLLVQLPEAECERLAPAWGLPGDLQAR